MSQYNEHKERSTNQGQQASKNAAGKSKAPEDQGFDKKLDGPNRPST